MNTNTSSKIVGGNTVSRNFTLISVDIGYSNYLEIYLREVGIVVRNKAPSTHPTEVGRIIVRAEAPEDDVLPLLLLEPSRISACNYKIE